MTAAPTWEQLQGEERSRVRDAVKQFVSSVETGETAAIYRSLNAVAVSGAYGPAFRAVARLTVIPRRAQETFLAIWINDGDALRSELSGDLVLFDALWKLLPPYEGSGLRLYRGDSSLNRTRRTYGLSWSDSREVAEAFARFSAKMYQAGSVLLEVEAAASAIICAPAQIANGYGENEYLVDRRRLAGVRCVARYPD